MHQAELTPSSQVDRRLLPRLVGIWTTLGASEPQFLSWVLLCDSTYVGRTWPPESAIMRSPDGPTHLPTIWDGPKQRWHRGHILLQSEQPWVPAHSRDTLAAVMSIPGVDEMHKAAGLENPIAPPRKAANTPRQTVKIGLPEAYRIQTWISHNHLIDQEGDLATEAARIFQTAPAWLRQCGIHTKVDPVLGRCSWEEDSSMCIRFRQTHRFSPQLIDRTTMRFNTCAILNKLQSIC